MRLVAVQILLYSLLLFCTNAGAQQQVYTYVDEDGTIHFTDMPRANARSFLIGDRVIDVSKRHMTPRKLASPIPYADHFNEAAMRYGLDAELIAAVAQVESSFNPRAVSHKGAKGLMQLMDATASDYGVREVFDPAENIDAGARHLRDLLAAFNGDLTLSLAAYNAGRTAVSRHGGVPPYRETRRYLEKISKVYGDLDTEISESQIISSYTVAQAVSAGKTVIYRFRNESGVNYSMNPPIGKPYETVRLRY